VRAPRYDQRWRDRKADPAWFTKATYLLDRGWKQADGEGPQSGWMDPVTGMMRTVNEAVGIERGRRAAGAGNG